MVYTTLGAMSLRTFKIRRKDIVFMSLTVSNSSKLRQNFWYWFFIASIFIVIVPIFLPAVAPLASGLVYSLFIYLTASQFKEFLEEQEVTKDVSNSNPLIYSALVLIGTGAITLGISSSYLDFSVVLATSFSYSVLFVTGVIYISLRHRELNSILEALDHSEELNGYWSLRKKWWYPSLILGILEGITLIVFVTTLSIIEINLNDAEEILQTLVPLLPVLILLFVTLCVWLFYEYIWYRSVDRLLRSASD